VVPELRQFLFPEQIEKQGQESGKMIQYFFLVDPEREIYDFPGGTFIFLIVISTNHD
jgi:hypothetical protein